MLRTRTKTVAFTGFLPKAESKNGGAGYDLGELRPPSSQPYGNPFDPWLYLQAKKSNASSRSTPVIPSDYNSEVITDNGDGRDRGVKPCYHLKTRYSMGCYDKVERSLTKSFFIPWYGSDYGYNIDQDCSIPLPSPSGMSLPPNPSESAISSIQTEAWTALYPNFNSGFSGLNSLIELKDFKSLFLAVTRGAWRAASMYASMVRKQKSTRTLGQLWLTDNFAIKPLIRDFVAAVDLSKKLNLALSRFNEKGSVPSTHHFKKPFFRESGSDYMGYNGFWSSWMNETAYTVTARVLYRRNATNSLDMFTRYYGLDMSLEKAWNAVPFSFVFDWFLNIGTQLAAMDVDHDVQCELSALTASIKRKCVRVHSKNLTVVEYPYSSILFVNTVPAETFGLTLPDGHVALSSVCHSEYVRTLAQAMPGAQMPSIRVPAAGIIFPVAALLSQRRS